MPPAPQWDRGVCLLWGPCLGPLGWPWLPVPLGWVQGLAGVWRGRAGCLGGSAEARAVQAAPAGVDPLSLGFLQTTGAYTCWKPTPWGRTGGGRCLRPLARLSARRGGRAAAGTDPLASCCVVPGGTLTDPFPLPTGPC